MPGVLKLYFDIKRPGVYFGGGWQPADGRPARQHKGADYLLHGLNFCPKQM